MAIITCSECGKEVSDKAPACPNCGNPTNAAHHEPGKPICRNCSMVLVPVQKTHRPFLTELIAAFIFVAGLLLLFINGIWGLIAIIVAFGIGVMNKQTRTVMVCPGCGMIGARLD